MSDGTKKVAVDFSLTISLIDKVKDLQMLSSNLKIAFCNEDFESVFSAVNAISDTLQIARDIATKIRMSPAIVNYDNRPVAILATIDELYDLLEEKYGVYE